ncbi:MAG: hypothetical protein RL220_2123, partial [Bacteroidota bacterium]
PTFEPVTSPQRNVLIEDFTGHDCGNCPDAHVVADEILAANNGRVAVVAIHAGPLAEPLPPEFPANWTTPEGELYFSQLDFQVNPIGRVNREGGANAIWAHTQWEDETANQLDDSPSVGLQMVAELDTNSWDLNVHVYHQWLGENPGSYSLVVLITESDIIAPQLEYLDGGGSIVHEDYEHNHMLRSSLSGPAGLTIVENPAANLAETESYTYEWNQEWDWHNSHVVAFVVRNSDGEVLNVVEKYLHE